MQSLEKTKKRRYKVDFPQCGSITMPDGGRRGELMDKWKRGEMKRREKERRYKEGKEPQE